MYCDPIRNRNCLSRVCPDWKTVRKPDCAEKSARSRCPCFRRLCVDCSQYRAPPAGSSICPRAGCSSSLTCPSRSAAWRIGRRFATNLRIGCRDSSAAASRCRTDFRGCRRYCHEFQSHLPSDCSWKCRPSHPADEDLSVGAPCTSYAHGAAAVAWDARVPTPSCLVFRGRRWLFARLSRRAGRGGGYPGSEGGEEFLRPARIKHIVSAEPCAA